MAKLHRYRIDSKAREDGEWVKLGDLFDDMEIRTRGYVDGYNSAKAARMTRAALGFNGDQSKIPSATQRQIVVDCLVQHVLLDVRGVEREDGSQMPFDEFCGNLAHPDFDDVLTAVLFAVGRVGRQNRALTEEAVGN